MADKTALNPRARYWRDLKTAVAGKVRTTRALERDLRARPVTVASTPPVRRRVASMLWRRPHPWEISAL